MLSITDQQKRAGGPASIQIDKIILFSGILGKKGPRPSKICLKLFLGKKGPSIF